jgi:hemerythrin-like domain-containing protein
VEKKNLFSEPAPDFTDPLGLLRACHERILGLCDTLLKLPAHIEANGVDDELRNAAANIHRYFSTAAQLHHQDEEQDIFPLLARQSLKLADLIHRLKQEHLELDALWQKLEPRLARPASIEDPEAFSALIGRFTEAYRSHAMKENEELLDIAVHIFSSEQLKVIGEHMAERRGQHR